MASFLRTLSREDVEEIVDGGEALPETEGDVEIAADVAAAEFSETSAEAENISADIEMTEDTVAEAEEAVEDIDAVLEEGEATPEVAAVAHESMMRMARSFYMEHKMPQVSVESIRTSPATSLRLSREGFMDMIKAGLEAIKRMLRKLWAGIMSLVDRVKILLSRFESRYEALVKAIKAKEADNIEFKVNDDINKPLVLASFIANKFNSENSITAQNIMDGTKAALAYSKPDFNNKSVEALIALGNSMIDATKNDNFKKEQYETIIKGFFNKASDSQPEDEKALNEALNKIAKDKLDGDEEEATIASFALTTSGLKMAGYALDKDKKLSFKSDLGTIPESLDQETTKAQILISRKDFVTILEDGKKEAKKVKTSIDNIKKYRDKFENLIDKAMPKNDKAENETYKRLLAVQRVVAYGGSTIVSNNVKNVFAAHNLVLSIGSALLAQLNKKDDDK